LIVGVGLTGLELATHLQTFGVRFRIIDRLLHRTRKSRALGIQARTLELLLSLGLGERRSGCVGRPLKRYSSGSSRVLRILSSGRSDNGGRSILDHRTCPAVAAVVDLGAVLTPRAHESSAVAGRTPLWSLRLVSVHLTTRRGIPQ
jgi:2-polyprenyl-6-methoxyphenol hydroxylase-like FAD-dependent oxidoreductase